MTALANQAPDQVLPVNDPGDATGARYKFQWAWSAIVACMLFDSTQGVIEVFCEQLEDVLLKHRDGTCTGHQVKTRDSDQPVWKANEEQVVASCARFVQHEADHPGHFRAYRFVTNHPLHSAKNAQCLKHNLAAIAAAATLADLPSPVAKWLRTVASKAGQSESLAFQGMKKTTATDELPKTVDCLMRLIDALSGCWDGAAEASHTRVRSAALALIDECGRAAALGHEQLLPAYFAATHQPDVSITARIDGKRLTPDRVAGILRAGLDTTATLAGQPNTHVEPGQGSTDLMMKKLDAGGFSVVSCNSAEDLRDKADYLGIVWTNKLGRSKGLERYNHIRSIALSDAARAFEETKNDAQPFGHAMRENLRQRFIARRTAGERLFECSDEHLEGFAYSLTAQCKVQWSINRPWEAT